MIRQDQVDRLREIIRRARAAGNAEALAEAGKLLGKALQRAALDGAAADPMSRAHTREDDGLRKLRKGRDECTATRRDGQPCRAPVVEGTLVCRRHGGSAPQVLIKARHTLLMEAAYLAHLAWQEARGTPREFDALRKALQAQRDLDAYEVRLAELAELRAELKRSRAADGTRRTP